MQIVLAIPCGDIQFDFSAVKMHAKRLPNATLL